MNGGVIQQIDTPKNIYQRPANLFVSTFIGLSNIMDGTVDMSQGGTRVRIGDYSVAMDNLDDAVFQGQPVKVSVRPEEFIISRSSQEGIPAIVRSSVFLGVTTHYFVESEDGREMEVIQNSDIWDIIPDHTRCAWAYSRPKSMYLTRKAQRALLSGGSTHEICRREKLNIWIVMALGILALFILFVVYPLVLVLYKSVLSEDGQLSFAYFTKFFARKYYWSTLVGSFKVTILSTVVAAFLGLVMAYVLRSVRIKGSKYLNILIVISYLSPPFIGAYAWIQLLGRNGFFTKILNGLFHVKLGGIYGFAGIVLVFSLQSFPLVYMYISGALKNLDNSLNEAAESLGCTAFQRVTRIIVPLVMPTMLASSLLVFMRVFSDFGTPMLIGEGYKTFPVLIYSQFMGRSARTTILPPRSASLSSA